MNNINNFPKEKSSKHQSSASNVDIKKIKEDNRLAFEARINRIEKNLNDISRRRLRPRDAKRVAERMHFIIENIIKSGIRNDEGSKLTRENIASNAFDKDDKDVKLSGPLAGRLRRYTKDPGDEKDDLIQRADKYLPLVDTLLHFWKKTKKDLRREDLLVKLFEDTALDMTQEEIAQWELGEWITSFVDDMNQRAEEIGNLRGLANYYKQVNAYNLWRDYEDRLRPIFYTGHHEDGNPLGRISMGFLPLASNKERKTYPFLLYGFLPMVPLYHVPLAGPFEVRLRFSGKYFRAGDYSTESHNDDLKHKLRNQIDKAPSVNAEVYACCTMGLALAPVDDNGRTRLLYEFTRNNLISMKGNNEVIFMDPSTFPEYYQEGETYFLVNAENGHITENSQVHLVSFEKVNDGEAPDWPDHGESDFIVNEGAVVYEPFDTIHCYKYLVELPENNTNYRKAFKIPETPSTAHYFPGGAFGASLEDNIYHNDEHNILRLLDERAKKLVEALREFKERNSNAVKDIQAKISFEVEDEEDM